MIELSQKQIFHPQGVPMNISILPLFSDLDDFCHSFEPAFKIKQLESGIQWRHRKATLILSEVMTILVWFRQCPNLKIADNTTTETIVES
jgi:hypothetical protein